MAEKALEKLTEELNCPICLDTFDSPKQLQCNHIYCKHCLAKLVIRDGLGNLSICCPSCRMLTSVPVRGVKDLPSAFHINNLLEIQDSVKDLYSSLKKPESQQDSLSGTDYCSKHAGEELKLYCETCRKLVCLKCALKGNVHYTHEYHELTVAFKDYKEAIGSSLAMMEKELVNVNSVLAELDARQGEIDIQQAVVQADIQNAFQRLHEILNKRNEALVRQLNQLAQEKKNALSAQRKDLKIAQSRFIKCMTSMREVLANDDAKILAERKVDPELMSKLCFILTPDCQKPKAVADLTFDASHDIAPLCEDFGRVLASTLPYPPNCQISGKGLEIGVVGEKSTAIFQAVNFESMPCELPAKSLECELVSEITGTKLLAKDFDITMRQNQHLISYIPRVKGNHQLHVKVDGQEITGSPFSVIVRSPVEKLGTTILVIEQLNAPRGVVINRSCGEVIVTEYSGHCVSVFSYTGKRIRSFGSHGSSQGQFKYPCGVALDGEGNIFVADSLNNRIQKLTVEGEFVSVVDAIGSGFHFNRPNGIAYSPANDKIYVSDDTHHIHILNSDLTFFKSFGKEGHGKGQFVYPSGIACDSTGQVYIADSNNHRIQVFSAEGKFLRAFGQHGSKSGVLKWPVGISITEASGLVYVSENSNKVSVFTLEGLFVMSFGQDGEGSGQFKHPYGLAVDSTGVVFVCDTDNNRVQMF